MDTIVVCVKVSDIVTWIVRLIVKVIPKHVKPDVVTSEHYFLFFRMITFNLVKHTVFWQQIVCKPFKSIKE